jgi:hypothetical protein
MKKIPGLALITVVASAVAIAGPVNDSLFVQIAGDSVCISDFGVLSNCASRFVSSLALSRDTLTWVQTDTVGPRYRCMCRYDMEVSMTGLDPGTYTTMVYRQFFKQYQYNVDTLEFVGFVRFTIGVTGGQFAARAFHQSECYGIAEVQEQVMLTPAQVSLCNYPNPFNPATVVSVQLPAASTVWLAVYDMLGREMRTLVNEQKPAGLFTVQFDGSGLSSGVYLCRLRVQPSDHDGIGPPPQVGAAVMLTTMMVLAK